MKSTNGFSEEWNELYKEKMQMSLWPWTDVVSLFHRHCKKNFESKNMNFKVLELGCGAGANIPFFQTLGIDYYAIEGSHIIVNQLHRKYPNLENKINVGDFTIKQPFTNEFDLVLDRAAVTHNNTNSIKKTLELAFNSLIPGGIYIGCDWFSNNHDDMKQGKTIDDEYTKHDHTNGQFVGAGIVHYSSESHMRELFRNFKVLFMEEKVIKRYVPNDKHQFAAWNIVAIRP